MRLGGRRGLGLEQRSDVVQTELLADHRSALEDGALARAEPVEACGEKRLDRLRDRAARRGRPRARGRGAARGRTGCPRRPRRSGRAGRSRGPSARVPRAAHRRRRAGARRAPRRSRCRAPPRSRGGPRAARRGRRRPRGSTPRPDSTRCSTRSRKVGSAQWTSSKTRTSGCSAASASQSCRKSQAISGAGGDGSAPRARNDRIALLARAAASSTSRSGQYVMPSPYERQRPESGVTPFEREATSAASRDLPIPGGPDTTTRPGKPVSTARLNAFRIAASSRFRPTSWRRGAARTPERRVRSRGGETRRTTCACRESRASRAAPGRPRGR